MAKKSSPVDVQKGENLSPSKKVESKKKPRRLKKNADFLELKQKGLRFKPSDWLQIQFLENKGGALLVGVTVSRKVATAVTRNKLKRWCHEYFISRRSQFGELSGHINFLFRPHRKENFYKELEHELLDATIDKGLKQMRKGR